MKEQLVEVPAGYRWQQPFTVTAPDGTPLDFTDENVLVELLVARRYGDDPFLTITMTGDAQGNGIATFSENAVDGQHINAGYRWTISYSYGGGTPEAAARGILVFRPTVEAAV